MWHLFAVANILHSKVVSIFPDKGEEDMRSLAKRTIPPQDQSATSAKFIMWTSHREDLTEEHWVPSHFVPLLPLHPSSDEPSVVAEEEDISDNTLNTGFLFERYETEWYSINDKADKDGLFFTWVQLGSSHIYIYM